MVLWKFKKKAIFFRDMFEISDKLNVDYKCLSLL